MQLNNSGEVEQVSLDTLLEEILHIDEANDDMMTLVDNHYDPLQPDAYISFRVLKAIRFYKSRIPACSKTLAITQGLMIIGSISTACVAFWNLSSWSGVISIVTSSLAAYLEYNGTSDKILRYSFTVNELQNLVLWWNTLTPIDKASMSNIDKLVLTCEDLLEKERNAWTSMKNSSKKITSNKV